MTTTSRKIINLLKNVNDRSLSLVIFFVTSKCNATCPSCFYWEDLNKKEDLTLEEITKLSLSMPPFKELLFSGGEPFLRDELYEIVSLFHNNAGINNFSFPTNGSLPDRISNLANKVLRDFPEVSININFSIDGLPDYHDKFRGIANGFNKIRQSIKQLTSLKEHFGSRLKVQTNTVITYENFQEIDKLLDYFENSFETVDDNLFEIIRGSPKDKNLKGKIPEDRLFSLYKRIRWHKIQMLTRNKTSAMETVFKLTNLMLIQNMQYKAYNHREWGVPCLAGQAIGVIDHNGSARICELRKPAANLRAYDMDFSKLNNSEAFKRERQNIKTEQCWSWCTHICFIYHSIFSSYKTMFAILPVEFAKSLAEVTNYYLGKNTA